MQKRWKLWVIVLCAVYAATVWLNHRAMPLGQVALLDAREQQLLAHQIAHGTLPAEPFYRAPLWAATLAVGYSLGLDDDGVLMAGQVLNVLLHLLAAWAIGGCAWNLWRHEKAAWLAGALYALYPVGLYLSVDLLDTTLAQALLCGGLWALTSALQTTQRTRAALLMGLLLGLATLTRPNLAVVGLAASLILLWKTPAKTSQRHVWVGLAAWLSVLVIFGWAEERRIGKFYLWPTQGIYNLWSANRPGATGEYYAQQIEMTNLPEGENPAKAEATILYRREAGLQAPVSQAHVNAFWQAKLWQYVTDHPAQVAGLYAKKLYALLNNHEAYNNKTYAWQKAQNTALRHNPLGWALIASLSLAVVLLARPAHRGAWLTVAGVLWACTAIFYTSDRFRLHLVPFIIALAAGAPIAWQQAKRLWREAKWGSLAWRAALVAVAAILMSLPLAGVGQRDTTSADRQLMAQAALKVGQDAQVIKLLMPKPKEKLQELTQTQIESLLQARYNMMLKDGDMPHLEDYRQMRSWGQKLEAPSPQAMYVLGLVEWQLEGKRELWHQLAAMPESPTQLPALAALLATGPLWAEEVVLFEANKETQELSLLLAQAHMGSPAALERLAQAIGSQEAPAVLERWRKLFDRSWQNQLNETHAP